MKRFKITLMVPHSTEVVVADAQAAHNSATHLANQPTHEQDAPATFVHSVEEIEDVITEPIDFGVDENV
jgi:hypothetical protein